MFWLGASPRKTQLYDRFKAKTYKFHDHTCIHLSVIASFFCRINAFAWRPQRGNATKWSLNRSIMFSHDKVRFIFFLKDNFPGNTLAKLHFYALILMRYEHFEIALHFKAQTMAIVWLGPEKQRVERNN